MSDPIVPTTVLTDTIGKLLSPQGLDLKINFSGTLPGETLIGKIFDYATEVRKDMDPALRTRLDAITIQQLEDAQHIWRSIWVGLGLLK